MAAMKLLVRRFNFVLAILNKKDKTITLKWLPLIKPCLQMLQASRGLLPTGLRSFSSQCARGLQNQQNQRLSFNKFNNWSFSHPSNSIYVKQNQILKRTLCTLRTVRDPLCRISPQRIQLVLCRGRLEGPTAHQDKANRTGLIYVCAIGIFMVGAAYAGVPLYRMFCQAMGRGGQAVSGHDVSKVATMSPIKDRTLTIKFNADVASSMQWNFRPQQSEVRVLPGETALAFYTARNPTDKPIIGISTYNVVPFEAGAYFNKIQCFCFEEQRLNPHEQVDMPVFFYIDPDFAEDPKMDAVDQITLSYTFFESKEGLHLPLPGYAQPHAQPQA